MIDGQGLTVYAGFVDAGANVLLDDFKPVPIEAQRVDVTRYALAGMRSDDHASLTPEYSVAEHLKPQAADLDKFRQAGFVAVHVLPMGRIASGQGAVVNLASLPPRETILSSPSFTTLQFRLAAGSSQYPSTKMGVHAHLRQTFLDAERHAKQLQLFSEGVIGIDRPAVDSVLEAFTAIRSGKQRTIFLADDRDDLERALNFAAEHRLRIAIWGGEESYRLMDRLKKTETDIVLQVDFGDEPKIDPPKPGDNPYPDLPDPKSVREHKRSEWKERVKGLSELHRAGIRFAISSQGGKSPSDLLKSMRLAIANGLDRDAALAAMTTQAAAILGLEKELGAIAVRRPAYFVAMTGPFDNEQSKVRHVVISGHRYEYNKDAKPVELTKPGEPAPAASRGFVGGRDRIGRRQLCAVNWN